ncbi:MAG: hypothetical protein HOH04_08265 [Rhodospirillaceae bacterium]|jgi:dienelactone hydrolase|nr:hypothetical protein [Rhodospirillaceae bacterium]
MPRRFFTLAIVSIAAFIAVFTFQAERKANAFEATDDGAIDFPTSATWEGDKVTGTGELNLPDGANGKVPVVILNHGTRGIGYRENKWSDFLLEKGYATFVLDYFSPRGVSGRGRNIPRPGEDVWGALSVLSAHPGLDMNKVAVMGFSNGGSVTRNAAGFDPETDTKGVLPKAFIMVYGGCHSEVYLNASDYNPALLYIAGGEDKLVKASTCLRRKSDSVSTDIDVMVIEGAYHMFDSNSTRTINHPKWGTVEMRADSDATDKARARVVKLLTRVFQ